MKKLRYFAFFGNFNSSGIVKKIDNTVEAANSIGYKADRKFFINRLSGLISFIRDIILGDEDVIIIRHYDLFMPIIFPFLLFRKIKGSKLILDIPTPRTIQIKELHFDNKSNVHIFLRTVWNYFSFTWILLPFTRIIQYSEESEFFSFGVKKRMYKIGNGIKIDVDLPIANKKQKDKLSLIAVATLSAWHGYDRLINALAYIKKENPLYPIDLTIVGDGPELHTLKNLVDMQSLENIITFTGALQEEDLTQVFEGKHVGIASLGLFRKGVSESADLKTREYMARGLCVLGTGKDPDFPEESPFRFLVSNDESIDSIVEMLLSLKIEDLPDPKEVRKFAENNLSYASKIAKIIG